MVDADGDARTIGRRVRQIRFARDESLRVVAELAGMSKSHLQRIERGERALDRRSEIVALANALQVAPGELTKMPVPAPGNGDTDADVNALRLAIQRASFGAPGGHVVDVDTLQRRVHSLLAAQNRCEHESVGAALPALVADLHASIADGRDVAQQLALAALLHVQGTHSWLRTAGASNDLCFAAARLGREAAQELGEPVAVATAAFGAANGLIASGDFDLARIELDRAALAPISPETEQLVGALAVTRSLLAAAQNQPADEVESPIQMAAQLAARTGERNAYYLGFGPTSVGVWRMSVALEAGDHARAAAVAEQIRPERLANPTRQATYFTGYGRALARLRGRQDDAVVALRRAERISPGKVQRNPFARDVIAELLARSRRDAVGRELRGMAYRAGLPV
ncbi:MAG: helix-turn-helix domain-containing protein [Pseudonocardiaceae bacterium]